LGEPVGSGLGPDALKQGVKLREAGFTGCWALSRGGRRLGFTLYAGGKPLGGVIREGRIFAKADAAEAEAESLLKKADVQCDFLKLDAEAAAALAAGVKGRALISRLPTACLNFDEYLAWTAKSELTALVSIIAGALTANILIYKGKPLGAGIILESKLKPELDEALALFYSPGATLEVLGAD
jgi:hypothetical protein